MSHRRSVGVGQECFGQHCWQPVATAPRILRIQRGQSGIINILNIKIRGTLSLLETNRLMRAGRLSIVNKSDPMAPTHY